jgi:predicted short-subunit dehydrogenase-like oxidoreductase (DUF2520 family)
MQKSLTVIGAGKVGKTLARLWTLNQTYEIRDVLTRTPTSAQRAVDFIGAGQAVNEYTSLRPADFFLIASPDNQIRKCCEALATAGLLCSGNVVFHCSGALPSSALAAATRQGAAVASVHPIRSFASPEQRLENFEGIWCGVEGDRRAIDALRKGFAAIGAQWVPIKPKAKILYHAAAVFASNYLVTLTEVAKQAYMAAGVPADVALQLLQPLMQETLENIFRLGPEAALTGPIARGDMAAATRQYQAVANWNAQYAELYNQFVTLTAELAARRKA